MTPRIALVRPFGVDSALRDRLVHRRATDRPVDPHRPEAAHQAGPARRHRRNGTQAACGNGGRLNTRRLLGSLADILSAECDGAAGSPGCRDPRHASPPPTSSVCISTERLNQ